MKRFSGQKLKYIIACCLSISLFSCEQEAPHPQWDIDVLGPVLNATLGIDQLISDSLISTDADGRVRLVYEGNLSNLKPDSIYSIPDTSIRNLFLSPFSTPTWPAGAPLITPPQDIKLNIQGPLLTYAHILSGSIRFTARNTLPTPVKLLYAIPQALKNGQSIILSRTLAAGSVAIPTIYSADVDLSGYSIELTGKLRNSANTIYYTLSAYTDSAGGSIPINAGDTLFNLVSTFAEITPDYIKGYIGQKEFEISDGIDLAGLRNIESGTLSLDSASLSITVENEVGADLQAEVRSLTAINTRNQDSISLNAPTLIGRSLNLTRAIEPFTFSNNVSTSQTNIVIDRSNSNLPTFLQTLPDVIRPDLKFSINPFGNISGNSDFIYKDRLISTHTRLEIPLRLSMNNLTLCDTQELSIGNLTDLDPVGPMNLTLVAENGFPVDLRLQLIVLDPNHNPTDTLFAPGIIPSAQTDANHKVTAPTITRLSIPVTADRKARLTDSSFMLIRASLTTAGSPDMVDLYSSYRLKVKLIADGNYSIR